MTARVTIAVILTQIITRNITTDRNTDITAITGVMMPVTTATADTMTAMATDIIAGTVLIVTATEGITAS